MGSWGSTRSHGGRAEEIEGRSERARENGREEERGSEREAGGRSVFPFYSSREGEVVHMRGREGATWPMVPARGQTTALLLKLSR